MGRRGRLYSKVKAKPRDYRFGVYVKGIVPKLVRHTNDEKQAIGFAKGLTAISRQKVKKIRKKKGMKFKKVKRKASKIHFVYDFEAERNIYP